MTPQYKTIVDTRKFNKITAIVIGIALSVPLLFFSFLMFQNVLTRASNSAPRDVVISNITQTSVKINWTTDQETQGVIEYGTSPTKLDFYAPEAQKTKDHSVEIDLLTPKTGHYFQIRIGDQVFDNGGVPWTFTTRVSLSDAEEKITTPLVTLALSPTMGVIPSPTKALSVTCTETDCQKIRAKFGAGCSVSDYIKCVQTSSNSAASPTPAENATPNVSSLGPTSKTNGSSDSDKNPAFSFILANSSSSAGTIKFQIQIDDNADFSSYIIDYTSSLAPAGARGFTVGQALDGGTYGVGLAGQKLNAGSYYWRIRAIDSRGLTSPYSVANNGNIAFIVSQ